MSGGINDGAYVFVSFEFPKGDIDGDTSFSFGFKVVKNPGVFERSFSHFLSFFLKFFNGSLVNSSALVDQVSGRGGFSGVDVSNNDEGDMWFIFRGH